MDFKKLFLLFVSLIRWNKQRKVTEGNATWKTGFITMDRIAAKSPFLVFKASGKQFSFSYVSYNGFLTQNVLLIP